MCNNIWNPLFPTDATNATYFIFSSFLRIVSLRSICLASPLNIFISTSTFRMHRQKWINSPDLVNWHKSSAFMRWLHTEGIIVYFQKRNCDFGLRAWFHSVTCIHVIKRSIYQKNPKSADFFTHFSWQMSINPIQSDQVFGIIVILVARISNCFLAAHVLYFLNYSFDANSKCCLINSVSSVFWCSLRETSEGSWF